MLAVRWPQDLRRNCPQNQSFLWMLAEILGSFELVHRSSHVQTCKLSSLFLVAIMCLLTAKQKRQNSDVDFAYRTKPQKLQQNRSSYWPRGKVLGGCSSINYMLAVRGDSRGYDKWENEYGCTGWAFKYIEKYFNRLENYTGKLNLPNRGRHGPITITDNRDKQYVTKGTVESFVKGCTELGIPEVADYNAPNQTTSAGASQTTIRDGKRCDTATGYLFGESGAFATCPNLSCLAHEQVARVTFDTSGSVPRANGIELISGPVIKCREEVVLSAGAVGSAHILLLSGVGPKVHLESKNVKVVADLPGVGHGLKDHLMVAQPYELRSDCPSAFNANNPIQTISELAKLFVLGDGLLVSFFFLLCLYVRPCLN